MLLNHICFGDSHAKSIVMLHGLLGSARNWVTIGGRLAIETNAYAVDLRNHGASPHADEMTYQDMAEDVVKWLDSQKLEDVHLVGHSMGGKVAMLIATNYPEQVRCLTIADIAPKSYHPHFREAFEAMKAVNPNDFSRIKDVELALAAHLGDPLMRQFLVTNLKRNPDGNFDWQVNLRSIDHHLKHLSSSPMNWTDQFWGPTQLLHGENSDFVSPDDFEAVEHHFPSCQFVEVPNAGHNVHIDQREFVANKIIIHDKLQ
ncbi:MAG: alpha/beta fold hydrolase [Opitutales bacterium]|nr:alpha/beta fold hydrolase [Opitutales bacterium]